MSVLVDNRNLQRYAQQNFVLFCVLFQAWLCVPISPPRQVAGFRSRMKLNLAEKSKQRVSRQKLSKSYNRDYQEIVDDQRHIALGPRTCGNRGKRADRLAGEGGDERRKRPAATA
jgi:hypothetical protein